MTVGSHKKAKGVGQHLEPGPRHIHTQIFSRQVAEHLFIGDNIHDDRYACIHQQGESDTDSQDRPNGSGKEFRSAFEVVTSDFAGCQGIRSKGHQKPQTTDKRGDWHHQTESGNAFLAYELCQDDGIEGTGQLSGSSCQDGGQNKAFQGLRDEI